MYLLNGLPALFGVTLLHLTAINIVVMLVETGLLKRLSKADRINGWYIILANVVSALLGLMIGPHFTDVTGGNFWFGSLEQARSKTAFILGLVLFIIVTMLIETPFYYSALRKKRSMTESLKYSSLINLATNIPIAILYYNAKMAWGEDK